MDAKEKMNAMRLMGFRASEQVAAAPATAEDLAAAKARLGEMGSWLVERGFRLAGLPRVESPSTFDWLFEAIDAKGGGVLNVRAALSLERRAHLMMVCQVVGRVLSADLRDNRLDGEHLAQIAKVLVRPFKIAKLNLGGNRITAGGLRELAISMSAADCTVLDLDISRNPICRVAFASDAPGAAVTAPSYAGVEELGKMVALSAKLSVLSLSKGGLSDKGASSFFNALAEHAPQPAVDDSPAPVRPSTAGVGTAVAFKPKPKPKAVLPPLSPALVTLDLSNNQLTPAFIEAFTKALPVCHTLANLNLSGNNLGVEGGVAVARTIALSPTLRTLNLSATNLCSCSPAYVRTPTCEWNGEAVLALSDAMLHIACLNKLILSGNELCGLWKEHVAGEYRILGSYTTFAVDALIDALRRHRVTLHRDGVKVDGNLMRPSDEKRIQQALIENERIPKKNAAAVALALATIGAANTASPLKEPSSVKNSPAGNAIRSRADTIDDGFGGLFDDLGGAVLELGARPPSPVIPADEGEAETVAGDSSLANMTVEGATASVTAAETSLTKSLTKSLTAAPKAPKAAKAAAAKAPQPEETKGKERESYSQKKGEKKKKEEKAVEVEEDPLGDLPLMISTTLLQVRIGKEADSPKVEGDLSKLPAGALMRVLEEYEFTVGITKQLTKRTKVQLDGDSEPVGWVTALTPDGVECLRISNASFKVMRAAKVLVCREGKDNNSKKVDDIPRGRLLRVLETFTREDGSVRASVGKDGAMKDVIGWITLSKPDAPEEVNLEEVPNERASFDLKKHTADACARALKRKIAGIAASALLKKGRSADKTALPFMERGRKPSTRSPDDGKPSRHALVTQQCELRLLVNCCDAAFKVTEWSGALPFDLPGEQAFDLMTKKKKGSAQRKLGRVRIPADLGTPFLERIEFPDEWVPGDECGLEHDGWQGEGYLELELICGKDTATIQIFPWLSYGCTVGARLNIRAVSASFGQCATVVRILGDDRVVARVDGHPRDAGVKSEVIVDLSPSTVVPASSPGYERGTKLLLLFRNKLVDATVMEWAGKINYEEGSRHMVNVKPLGAAIGYPAWPSLNEFNHVPAPPGMSAEDFEGARSRYCESIAASQDTVEDAITGNLLPIKDQLIFMRAVDVKDGCTPPEFMSVADVPQLVEQCVAESPLRVHGGHNAQPVLCRAGPGTGKTWMIKQSMYLLSTRLMGDAAGDGVRLMPFVLFVQRIVRLLNEHGEEPSVLLANPEGMLRWYIRNECADNKERCQLLLTAYDLRALVILVDGVDEAAGMRDVVEAFVHYELVPSGNRLVVTSRPEGVDLEDYRRKFVVMNLTELSQEQQRNVIQMQLQGNQFFEHLVNLAECRRDLDDRYHKTFSTETIRTEIQTIAYVRSEEKKEGEKEVDEDEDEDEEERKPLSRADQEKRRAEAEKVVLVPETRVAAIRRRLSLENQQDMQTYLSRVIPELQQPMKSTFLGAMNKVMLAPTKAYANLLDQLDLEIKNHPSPCTRAQLEQAIGNLESAQKDGKFSANVRESLLQLAMIRKVPLPGGRRGAKAAPMPAQGLWCQAVRVVDAKYSAVAKQTPLLMEALARLAGFAGLETTSKVPALGLKRHPDFVGGAPSLAAATWVAHSAGETPELTYRDPIALWLESTYPGATEPTEQPRPAWVASVSLRGKTGEQCVTLLKSILQGAEFEVDNEPTLLTPLSLQNTFHPEALHPTHVRRATCHTLLSTRAGSIAVNLVVEHRELAEQYEKQGYVAHYNYFCDRVLSLSQPVFDAKFETLLVFLVEAIGIPVLLSLLLLTYSSSGGEVIELEELPPDRLQLYKLGIMSGIRKRLALAVGDSGRGATEVREEDADQNKNKRVKRKGALEQNLGNSSGKQEEQHNAFQVRGPNQEPVLDLNSMLRGKKVRVVNGENEVGEAYALVVRVLDRCKGADLRTAISAIVPKSHSLHAVVTAFVEYVLAPISVNEQALYEVGKKMLRNVAVENQQNGRREFTSKHVACALGQSPEELGLWSRLDLDHENGVALTATLSKQTEKAPAQYQFKHLSFQEGLYAEYLLLLITSLQSPGPGWAGWATNTDSAAFLNNRYMNNTCRIAAGHLGSLLAKQRADWDFREAALTPNGRMALWYITDENDTVASINVAHNDVGLDDVPGLSKTIATCDNLKSLDLSENELHHLSVDHLPQWRRVCEALGSNTTLTDLNMNRNRLGPVGIRVLCKALLGCTALERLGLSFNEPGIEPMMCELFRAHPSLKSVELVEAVDRHLPNRAKDDIGRALLENKARKLGFVQCDTFVLSPETTSLVWPEKASTSDAVLLAGALVTNTTLTSFNIAPGATLANAARSALGEALLNNSGSCVAFCNDFGLQPKVATCEFDLSKPELKDVEPFRLLAGCLRGNRTLTHVTLKQLRSEQIPTLALALRGNSTLSKLDIVHVSRHGGQSLVRLPVPELNGSVNVSAAGGGQRVDMSPACLEGTLNRVACEMIGTLIAANTSLRCLDLSNTGIGLAIGAEGEGGHILLRPLCESKLCPLEEINLTNVQLSDKAGAKLLTAFSAGMSKRTMGYEKITSLSLARNQLADATGALLKELLWGERAPCMLKYLDLSGNPDLSGQDIALAVRRNSSLTSLDIRNIPSFNEDSVFKSIGSFLLQEGCQCRLGFLLCDKFEVRSGQKELRIESPTVPVAVPAPVKGGLKVVSRESVLMMLAGILKFNSSLTKVEILNMGLDDRATKDYYYAIKENTVLEYLDISGNPVGAAGIAEIAEAVRTHPALQFFKVDGAALPVRQVLGLTNLVGDAGGVKGSEGGIKLQMADWGLGPLSGQAIGIIAKESTSITDLDLKNNALGAHGATALVNGLGAAPIKLLDLTRSGVGSPVDEAGASGVNASGVNASGVLALSKAICEHLGMLQELRMDENELECPVEELAPLCKLRNLRTLSMDKNRLTELPSLIGTMLSLRKISLHSNQLSSLPPSICLLVNLDTLDLHKNSLRTLPPNLGHLHALQRLDLSENKISELPISICGLSENAQISVGRNPLEKPSIEQARQGIGAIRRYFGYGKPAPIAGPDDLIDALVAKQGRHSTSPLALDAEAEEALRGEEKRKREAKRPQREEGAPSRHGWASPASVITLFNCQNATFRVLDGAGTGFVDEVSIPSDETAELIAAFNLQVIGRVRAAYSAKAEPFADRVQFENTWLPWRIQDVDAAGEPALTVIVKRAKSLERATLLVTPWLAYGCSVGARVKTATTFATITGIRPDDTCEFVADNSKHNVAILGAEVIDPRPDTVTRTSTVAYKSGQKLLLLHEGSPVDAVVEEWLGMRRGARHRVYIGVKASLRKKVESVSDKHVVEVDLNEANHTKLLFSTVTKYEATRQQYCDVLTARHRLLKDDALLGTREIPSGDQRLLTETWVPIVDDPAADAELELPGEMADKPEHPFPGPKPIGAGAGKSGRVTPDTAPVRPSSPVSAPTDAAASAWTAPRVLVEPSKSVVQLVDDLISSDLSNGRRAPPMLLRAAHPLEHELLHAQVVFSLASALRDMVAQKGAVRLVPLPVAPSRLIELMADEAMSKKPAREILVRAFELDNLGYAEMIKQALEMRAVVVIAKVSNAAEAAPFAESAMLEELTSSRLIVSICSTHEVPVKLPIALTERSVCKQLGAVSLVLSRAVMGDRDCKAAFKRLRLRPEGVWPLVRGIHLPFSDVGREGLSELQELLQSRTCALKALDLSQTEVSVWPVVQALRGNPSITSLDLRRVPNVAALYGAMASIFCGDDSRSALAYLRCDAFELLEDDKTLCLRETLLNEQSQPGALELLLGLLQRNTTVQELDLSATDLDKSAAGALASLLATNSALTSLKLSHNAEIDAEAQAILRAAAAARLTPLKLEI